MACVALASTASALPRPGAEPSPPGDSSSAASPDTAPGVVGAKKFATAVDCNGAVAFSSKSASTADAGKLHFGADLTDRSVGWNKDKGEFTTFCPGLYQFAFSTGGAPGPARLVLKKKKKVGDWEAVVSTGAGGGANVVLLDLDVGDQAAVFLEEGTLAADAAPSATFSGFRVAKRTP